MSCSSQIIGEMLHVLKIHTVEKCFSQTYNLLSNNFILYVFRIFSWPCDGWDKADFLASLLFFFFFFLAKRLYPRRPCQ